MQNKSVKTLAEKTGYTVSVTSTGSAVTTADRKTGRLLP
jgi:hypothetical protein